MLTFELPQDYLNTVLSYDETTGLLWWKEPKKGRRMSRPAGTKRRDGYSIIEIGGDRYYVHRIAWIMANGPIENGVIDHINGDPSDNRLENLRRVTMRENLQNNSRTRDGGRPGAHRRSNAKTWQARIAVEGKTIHLGSFATEDEAHAAYLNACAIVEKIQNGEI